mmetsp:Transcript_97488/g.281293  ORF Transcript_97488/g.281293 Transcript_97488/m.281293 type:complete len:293 (+) Transcript_97488:674-1552(+)
MAASFSAFSSARSFVAFATASWVSRRDTDSSSLSFCSSMRAASRESMSMRRPSISCVLLFLVCSLVAISLSHQPLCSVSRKASVFRRLMSSSISVFTLANGSSRSSRSCEASAESTELESREDSPRRNAAARAWLLCGASPRNCTSAVPFAAGFALRRLAAALTSLLDMISMAFFRAPISSTRVAWRLLYSSAFREQREVRSLMYVSVSLIDLASSCKSDFSCPAACKCLALFSVFVATAASAAAKAPAKSCANISAACLRSTSSSFNFVSLLRNLPCSSSSIVITSVDFGL